jgi:hypothetical protein
MDAVSRGFAQPLPRDWGRDWSGLGAWLAERPEQLLEQRAPLVEPRLFRYEGLQSVLDIAKLPVNIFEPQLDLLRREARRRRHESVL